MRWPRRRKRADLQAITEDANRRVAEAERLARRTHEHTDRVATLRADSRRLGDRNQIARLIRDGF